MILRAPKAKKFYKNENAWLNAVYRKNKELIDFSYPSTNGESSKIIFKKQVKQYKSKGYKAYKAVQMTTKTSAFMSKNSPESYKLFTQNFYKGLISDRRGKAAFLKMTGEKENKIKLGNFEFVGGNTYIYKQSKIDKSTNKTIRKYYYVHLIISKTYVSAYDMYEINMEEYLGMVDSYEQR